MKRRKLYGVLRTDDGVQLQVTNPRLATHLEALERDAEGLREQLVLLDRVIRAKDREIEAGYAHWWVRLGQMIGAAPHSWTKPGSKRSDATSPA